MPFYQPPLQVQTGRATGAWPCSGLGPGLEGQPLAGLDVNQADPELGSAHGPVPLEGRA